MHECLFLSFLPRLSRIVLTLTHWMAGEAGKEGGGGPRADVPCPPADSGGK